MEVVRGVDLKRYMGRWYEIACFPSRFQPMDGANTRATYSLKEDGTVGVVNETWSGGKRSYIQGSAFKVEEGKLKVKFWVPPFLPVYPVVGDYWIIHVDDEYQYAVVGQPSRRYLWVLSRSPHMEEDVYEELVGKAAEQGYDVSKLVKTPHSEQPPPDGDGPTDTKGFWWIRSLLGKY